MQTKRNLNGPYPRGVVNPYTAHVHPYPTRFHGGIYTRPVFGLPYVRSPHAVFKPDDFYEYYGVEGLGSVGTFNGSTMGNNLLGGNTLGLGATGSPIYYLASSSNPKVVTLQNGLNKVLVSLGYREIPVTGKLDSKTCAALGLMAGKFPAEVRAGVDGEILQEAANTCAAALKNSTVKSQTVAYAQEMEDGRNPTPAKVSEPTAPSGPGPVVYGQSNPKVTSLQGGLNKVLVAQGYPQIPVTGKLDYKTCAALIGLMNGVPAEVKSQVNAAILQEVSGVCQLASKSSAAVNKQMADFIQELERSRKQVPPQVLVPQTETVPPTTAPKVTPPPPPKPPAPTAPPVAKPVPVKIAEPQPIEFPEVEVTARPPDKSYGTTNWMLIGGAVLAAGAGVYFLRKKK